MAKGTVKFFNGERGFGFIETDESDDDVFFHVDDIDGPAPREGQAVEFNVEQNPRGPRAKNIQLE